MEIAEVASAVGQVASALLAIPASFIAYYAYRTARSSAEATAALTRIEAMRWHAELRPVLRLIGERTRFPVDNEPDCEMLAIYVELLGPAALHHVDNVIFKVRNYHDEIHPDIPLELGRLPEPYTVMKSPAMAPGQWEVGDRRTVLLSARHFRSQKLPLRFTLELQLGSYEPWIFPLRLEPSEFVNLEGGEANAWSDPYN